MYHHKETDEESTTHRDERKQALEDAQILDNWYHYAATAPGFLGAVLKTQREKASQTQEQQRNLLGILDKQYDQLWLRLQAMPMPRTSQFMDDLKRIVTKVISDIGIDVAIDIECLAGLIQVDPD